MKKLWARPLLILVLAAALAGCLRRWVPSAGVSTVPDNPKAALVKESGLELTVEAEDWTGHPANLPEYLTPVRVTLRNGSSVPIRIAYKDFTLTHSTGFVSAALPPFKIEGSIGNPAAPITSPAFIYSGFYVSPYYSPYYAQLSPWSGPMSWDPSYYERYYDQWRVSLPTRSMLEKAIPEGVLDPDGRISGYLYFQKAAKDLPMIHFNARFTDAKTGEEAGSFRIPFVSR